MVSHKVNGRLIMVILLVSVFLVYPNRSVYAATCTRSGCNGVNPYGALPAGTMPIPQLLLTAQTESC